MYGYIYKTTNICNGKIYIGQHKSPEFCGNSYIGSGKKLLCAVKHYGEDNFRVELIESIEREELMDEREIYWIQYYDSTNQEIGYNISSGGNCNRTMKGELHPMYGVSRYGADNPSYGKHWWTNGVMNKISKECPGDGWYRGVSDTVKQKHSECRKGRDTWNKGLTKSTDDRLNGNKNPRSKEFKLNLSKLNSGSGNPMYGKAGYLKYRYIYDNKEFLGKGELIEYLKNNGFPTFTANNIDNIVKGKPLRKFPELTGKIERITLSKDEIIEVRKKWENT